jgi:uncharacterized protein (TIGR02594 family)
MTLFKASFLLVRTGTQGRLLSTALAGLDQSCGSVRRPRQQANHINISREYDMTWRKITWRKTAAVVTLVVAPTFAAGSTAARQLHHHHHRVGDRPGFGLGDASERLRASVMPQRQRAIVMSASSSDAQWIATQLHQPHFLARRGQPESFSPDVSRANANYVVGGPRTAGSGNGVGPTRVVSLAQRYRGTNPTGHSRAWCAIFANMILARTGYRGSGSAAARSFAQYGRPASGPAPGVIAVWPHHVGFVVRAEGPGHIRVISGNHNHRVDESTYSTRSVMAFRYPRPQ